MLFKNPISFRNSIATVLTTRNIYNCHLNVRCLTNTKSFHHNKQLHRVQFDHHSDLSLPLLLSYFRLKTKPFSLLFLFSFFYQRHFLLYVILFTKRYKLIIHFYSFPRNFTRSVVWTSQVIWQLPALLNAEMTKNSYKKLFEMIKCLKYLKFFM